MTADEAAKYFAELNKQGELSDSELDTVAGGAPKGATVCDIKNYSLSCPFCDTTVNITITYYNDAPTEISRESCDCGAIIKLYPGSGNAYFKKDGEEVRLRI